MAISTREKLKRLYELFSGADHVLVLINADPDAIASAMAFNRLLWRRVTRLTISNINEINRPDNMAMIRLLDVTLMHVSKIEPHHYNKVVILDSQPAHSDAFSDFAFSVIIDHHPPGDYPAVFSDIRPEYGATSSILTEYLRASKIKPSDKLAAALFYGIKTDTNNFERPASNADIRSFQFLFRHANIHLVRRIEQVDLRLNYLEFFKQAIENKIIDEDKIFVHLGNIENPDILVLIADFFMRVNTVVWSVVSGIYDDRLIIIFRNDGLRKDAGNVANRCFGTFGQAGGHKSMARSEIPLENIKDFFDIADQEGFRRWIKSNIMNQLKKPDETKTQ